MSAIVCVCLLQGTQVLVNDNALHLKKFAEFFLAGRFFEMRDNKHNIKSAFDIFSRLYSQKKELEGLLRVNGILLDWDAFGKQR